MARHIFGYALCAIIFFALGLGTQSPPKVPNGAPVYVALSAYNTGKYHVRTADAGDLVKGEEMIAVFHVPGATMDGKGQQSFWYSLNGMRHTGNTLIEGIRQGNIEAALHPSESARYMSKLLGVSGEYAATRDPNRGYQVYLYVLSDDGRTLSKGMRGRSPVLMLNQANNFYWPVARLHAETPIYYDEERLNYVVKIDNRVVDADELLELVRAKRVAYNVHDNQLAELLKVPL